MLNLFPKPGKTYLIAAPAWNEKSAGVKVLHLLCHALNMVGQNAYLVAMDTQGVNPLLLTPYVTGMINDPIVIYPEIVHGNPLNAQRVVRYLLYYMGGFSGPKSYTDTDMLVGWTTLIAEHAKTPYILTLPCVDMEKFKPLEGAERKGSCFYASKYHFVYGGELQDITKDSTRIGNLPEADMIRLLQTSEVFYTYEDTALILEAVLCGCPTVLIRSEHFKTSVYDRDFGGYGFRWSDSPESNFTLDLQTWNARTHYRNLCSNFEYELEKFIKQTQEWKQ